MGYSYASAAGKSLDRLFELLNDGSKGESTTCSNTWNRKGNCYFYETGREQRDGAITGTVQRNWTAEEVAEWNRTYPSRAVDPNGTYCKRAGTFRIEPNGKVTRFPTSTKEERTEAYRAAREYDLAARAIGYQNLIGTNGISL